MIIQMCSIWKINKNTSAKFDYFIQRQSTLLFTVAINGLYSSGRIDSQLPN